jgi:glycosyltransferase involved in cell wall biosynthesis
VLTVTDEDKAVLTQLEGDSRDRTPIETIPIGVDTGYFHYSWRPEDAPRAVFVGTMYWPPNVDSVIYFCRDILPLARTEIPELEFDIVGLRPAKSVIRLEKTCSRVRVTGSVDDVRPYMAQSRLLAVPLRSGSGMRVKILNAMAVGVPVVTTSIGCEGIGGLVPVQEPSTDPCNENANIWISDSPEDFSRAVVKLAGDDKLARTLSRNGRKLVETTYDWSVISKRIVEVYDRIEESIAARKPNAGVHQAQGATGAQG